MPGALVETLAAGTALLPTQGLDRTTGQQAVPSWGYACSQCLPAPGPRMSMQHWTCVTLPLCVLPGPKSNRVRSGKGEKEPCPHDIV